MHLKQFLLFITLTLSLVSCRSQSAFNDTTKEARQKALQQLQKLDKLSTAALLKQAESEGWQQVVQGDLQHYKLCKTVAAFAKDSCFNLFREQNRELSYFFDAIPNAPQQALGREMIRCIEAGFYDTAPSHAGELERLPLEELRKSLLNTKQINRKHLFHASEGYLRFALYLDGKVRPKLKDDSLYQHLRKQLLSSRPAMKRGEKDLLDLELSGDTLWVEGKPIGSLAKIALGQASPETNKLRKALEEYQDRHITVKHNAQRKEKLEVAPDFYANMTEERTIVLDSQDSSSSSASHYEKAQKNGTQRGVFGKLYPPIDSNMTHVAPPLSAHAATLYMHNGAKHQHLISLFETLATVKINDIQIITDEGDTANIICWDEKGNRNYIKVTAKKSYKGFTLLESEIVRRSGSTKEPTRKSILSIDSSCTLIQFMNALNRASRERTATVQFAIHTNFDSIKTECKYRTKKHTVVDPKSFKKLLPIKCCDDPFGKGGHATGINAMLAGGPGLRRGGDTRRASGGMGFGVGTGSAYAGGVDDLMGTSTTVKRKKVKRVGQKRNSSKNAGMTGGRSRANIMRTVRNNMASLKYAYNRRLKAKPGAKGKIVVKWAIDEFGTVLHCKVVSSTMKDPTFEKEVTRKIKRWAFGKIPIPGDITEVTYPFVFNQ